MYVNRFGAIYYSGGPGMPERRQKMRQPVTAAVIRLLLSLGFLLLCPEARSFLPWGLKWNKKFGQLFPTFMIFVSMTNFRRVPAKTVVFLYPLGYICLLHVLLCRAPDL